MSLDNTYIYIFFSFFFFFGLGANQEYLSNNVLTEPIHGDFGGEGREVCPPKKNDITKICTCEKGCPRVGPQPQPIFFFSWADQRVLIEESFDFATHLKRILIFSFSFQNLQALNLT